LFLRKTIGIILLTALLLGSLTVNYLLYGQASRRVNTITFADANSRPTYWTLHRVGEAHRYGRGAGIKVGILDTRFGAAEHGALYAGTQDFLGDPAAMREVAHHGYFMALTLREIAPECEIYALGTMHGDPRRKVDAMVQAIDWAIANGLDVLTYSGAPVSGELRVALDAAIERAVAAGVVVCFIHNDHERNILPDGLFVGSSGYGREPDVRILQYDYNVLFSEQYRRYVQAGRAGESGDAIPYFSMSSTAPALGGFVAILKSIDAGLDRDACLALLQETSYTTQFSGLARFDQGVTASGVVDVGAAARRAAGR